MKTSVPCTESGCTYVAEHKKEVVAKRMLGMHRRTAHGIVGRHAHRNGTAHRNGNTRRSAMLVSALRVAEPRQDLSQKDVLRAVVDDMCFCPRCGHNIQRFLLATIALAKHEQSR